MLRSLALYENFSSKFPHVTLPKGAEHTIFLDPDVCFEGGAFLYPGVIIKGTSWIGDGSIIEPNSYIVASRIGKFCILAGRIEKSIVGDHVRINSNCRFILSRCKEYCDIKGEIENCCLGQRVITRPGCVMFESTCGDDCEIGAEVRKSHLGNRVKAVHQNSYLGNTTVGDGTNFASGSITLNFDGSLEKKKTEIGSGSFIGAGNLLVAPLVIGNNVATAAGLTIRADIPDDTFVGPDGTYRPNKLKSNGHGRWTREDKK